MCVSTPVPTRSVFHPKPLASPQMLCYSLVHGCHTHESQPVGGPAQGSARQAMSRGL